MILSPVSPIRTPSNDIINQLSSRHEDAVDRASSPLPMSHWFRRPGASHRSETESSARGEFPALDLESTPYGASTPTPSNIGSPRSTAVYDDTCDRQRLFPYNPQQSDWPLRSPRASHTSSRLDRPFTPDIPEEAFLQNNACNGGTEAHRWSSVSLSPPAYSQLYYEKFEGAPTTRQHRARRAATILNNTRLVLQFVVFLATVTVLGLLGHSLSAYETPTPSPSTTAAQDYLTWPTSAVSLTPTIILVVVAFVTLIVSSLLVLALCGKWTVYLSRGTKSQIGLSLFSICAWMGGLIAFEVLGSNNEAASLMGVACRAGIGSEGMGRVCTEQTVGFWFGLAACAGQMLALAAFLCELGLRMKGHTRSGSGGRESLGRLSGTQCDACGRA